MRQAGEMGLSSGNCCGQCSYSCKIKRVFREHSDPRRGLTHGRARSEKFFLILYVMMIKRPGVAFKGYYPLFTCMLQVHHRVVRRRTPMQKISSCLWFDDNAEEAVNFYTSIFKNSKIGSVARYGEEGPGQKGRVMTMTFQLDGQEFMALNGGPHFTFSPAISFFVNCETQPEIDELWDKLSEGGTVLMELDTYPFSEKFGWVADKFGVSWQLNLASRTQKIAPFFMYVGKHHGKAEEEIQFSIS